MVILGSIWFSKGLGWVFGCKMVLTLFLCFSCHFFFFISPVHFPIHTNTQYLGGCILYSISSFLIPKPWHRYACLWFSWANQCWKHLTEGFHCLTSYIFLSLPVHNNFHRSCMWLGGYLCASCVAYLLWFIRIVIRNLCSLHFTLPRREIWMRRII